MNNIPWWNIWKVGIDRPNPKLIKDGETMPMAFMMMGVYEDNETSLWLTLRNATYCFKKNYELKYYIKINITISTKKSRWMNKGFYIDVLKDWIKTNITISTRNQGEWIRASRVSIWCRDRVYNFIIAEFITQKRIAKILFLLFKCSKELYYCNV